MLKKIKRYLDETANDFNYTFIPRLLLRPMMKQCSDKKKIVGAEIGVKEGHNANVMLRCLDIEILYLIDPYVDYMEVGKLVNYSNCYKVMLKNIKHFKDRIVVIKKCSDEALNDIPDDLDFVYIDGNHNHPFVDNDIKNYYDKLKVGGLIGGHDFNYICPDVIEAVVDFSVKKNLKIFNYSSDWWFVK